MLCPHPLPEFDDAPEWFCVRSQVKHEHIAAARLRLLAGVEVFNPMLRLRKQTSRGPVWFTEALFPGYLFARFMLRYQLDGVRFTSGVKDVVTFGERIPTVPNDVIATLRRELGGELWKRSSVDLAPGDEVTVANGPLRGLVGRIERVMPAAQRVKVLLELLGRATSIELRAFDVIPMQSAPQGLPAAR